MKFESLLKQLKKEALVYDIETCAFYPDGREVNIRTNFEDYLEYAEVKWFGAYSFKHERGYCLKAKDSFDKIKSLMMEHNIVVGFNSNDFDYPILKNNGFVSKDRYHVQTDCMSILGKSTFKDRSGFSFKNRGELMDYKFKNNSLKVMAETMNLKVQKGDIDYKIFQKDVWTEEEEQEIKKYLKADVMATKGMFDKLWDFWKPFTDLLEEKYVVNLSWMRNSIASLTYKSACSLMGVEATYSEKGSKIEEMGGRVIMPKYEESTKVWYIDFTSLYPHIFCMFNLFAETTPSDDDMVWHGNDTFQVKGYYNISKQHPLTAQIKDLLKERIELKKTDPKNPMVYAIKILLNALYGCARSAIFEQVHTPNCGWDCCFLGQQIQIVTENMMKEFGFETIAGDTDSIFVIAKDESKNNEAYVRECLKKIVHFIKSKSPFPVDTYNIDIEHYIDYILFPFEDQPIIDEETGKNKKKGNRLIKERKGKKKNYLYVYTDKGEKKIKLVGLPIKKDNATALGIKIYNEVLKPKILEKNNAKFDETYIESVLDDYLKRPEVMELMAREFKVKPAKSYKSQSSIYAQISNGYFDGGDGIIKLIKNNKIGNAGKGMTYCTIDEAVKAKLTTKDIDLEKVLNELSPFIKNVDIDK